MDVTPDFLRQEVRNALGQRFPLHPGSLYAPSRFDPRRPHDYDSWANDTDRQVAYALLKSLDSPRPDDDANLSRADMLARIASAFQVRRTEEVLEGVGFADSTALGMLQSAGVSVATFETAQKQAIGHRLRGSIADESGSGVLHEEGREALTRSLREAGWAMTDRNSKTAIAELISNWQRFNRLRVDRAADDLTDLRVKLDQQGNALLDTAISVSLEEGASKHASSRSQLRAQLQPLADAAQPSLYIDSRHTSEIRRMFREMKGEFELHGGAEQRVNEFIRSMDALEQSSRLRIDHVAECLTVIRLNSPNAGAAINTRLDSIVARALDDARFTHRDEGIVTGALPVVSTFDEEKKKQWSAHRTEILEAVRELSAQAEPSRRAGPSEPVPNKIWYAIKQGVLREATELAAEAKFPADLSRQAKYVTDFGAKLENMNGTEGQVASYLATHMTIIDPPAQQKLLASLKDTLASQELEKDTRRFVAAQHELTRNPKDQTTQAAYHNAVMNLGRQHADGINGGPKDGKFDAEEQKHFKELVERAGVDYDEAKRQFAEVRAKLAAAAASNGIDAALPGAPSVTNHRQSTSDKAPGR